MQAFRKRERWPNCCKWKTSPDSLTAMHQYVPSHASHVADRGPCQRALQLGLASLVLLWMLGLALSLFAGQQAYAGTELFPAPNVMPIEKTIQTSGSQATLEGCVEKQLDRSCADAEANDLADPELPSRLRLSTPVVQVLLPTGVHGPLAQAEVRPLLRPPRITG